MAVSDVASNLNINPTGMIPEVGLFFKYLIPPIILAGLVWAVWWLLSHNIDVKVYRPQNNGSIGEKDKGRRTRDNKTRQIKGFTLLKNKKNYSGAPIDEKFFIPTKKMFGRIGYEVHMISDRQGNLQPIYEQQQH